MLYGHFSKYATKSIFISLIIVFVGLLAGFELRHTIFGDEIELLDPRMFKVYTPENVVELFENSGPEKLKIYAKTELTLDIAFPLVYGTMAVLLMIFIYEEKWAQRLLIIPLAGAGVDVLENFTIAFLAWSYSGHETKLSWLATIFTFTKSALLTVSIAIISVGIIMWLVKTIRK